jgi:3-dehydroquinate dehydratase-2
LHVSNIHRRPPPHRDSLVSAAATGVICGLGADGYRAAVDAILRMIRAPAR